MTPSNANTHPLALENHATTALPRRLPLPLEPAASPHNRNTLIHDPLPNAKILVDPALQLRRIRESGRANAGAERVSVSVS